MATETKTTEPKKKAVTPKAPRAKKPTVKADQAETETTTVEETTASGASKMYALGRRKTSIARVHLMRNGKGKITVNGKPMEQYFTTYELRNIVQAPLKTAGQESAIDIVAECEGGGIRGQAEAVRLGMARALTELNPVYRKTLKKLGFLTRDPRSKERKKPGLRRARRSPQWSKR